MRASFRALFVLAALAALLAVPAAASAYAPDTDEFVTCIRTTDTKIECVVELLNSPCLSEVVAARAKNAVLAAAQRQAARDNGPGTGNGPPTGIGNGPGSGNGNGPPGSVGNSAATDYEFLVPARPRRGDIQVTIECGPKRVRGALVAAETPEPVRAMDDRHGAALALAGVAGLVVALGAVELVASRRRRHG